MLALGMRVCMGEVMEVASSAMGHTLGVCGFVNAYIPKATGAFTRLIDLEECMHH